MPAGDKKSNVKHLQNALDDEVGGNFWSPSHPRLRRTFLGGWYDGICVRGCGLADGEEDRKEESGRLITRTGLKWIYTINDLRADSWSACVVGLGG